MSAPASQPSPGVAVNVHIHIAGNSPSDQIVEIAAPSGAQWEEKWHPTPTLDVWTAARHVGSCIELEVEVSRASFVPGRQARAWVPNATVTIAAGPGFSLVQDVNRPWPSAWPIKRGAWRRFGLYPSGRPDQRLVAQILARGQLANPNFDLWGPANMLLGSLNSSLAAKLSSDWNGRYLGLRGTLAVGTNHYGPDTSIVGWYAEDSNDAPVNGPNGWTWWGPADPMAPAGSGVYFSTGWQRCIEFARYALLACQPLHERMWLAYNKTTGEPITVDDYGLVTPKYWPDTHDPNNNDLPENRGVTTVDPIPGPYQPSHRIRHDRYPIAAFEFTGSPMCRRMVKHAAAQCRLQFSERGETDQWSYNIKRMLHDVQSNPHQGIFGTIGGRTLGEPAFVIAAAKKFGATDAAAWAQMFLDIVNLAAPAHGVLQREWEPSGAWGGGQNDMAHSFEVPMIEIGVVSIARQFGLPIPSQVATALRSVFVNSPLRDYYNGNRGPWDYLYVGAHGGASYPAITGGQTTPGSPEGDATHATLACALGYSVTHDPAFLDAMARVGLPAANWQAKLANLHDVQTGLDWDSFALGQLQVAAAHAQQAPGGG